MGTLANFASRLEKRIQPLAEVGNARAKAAALAILQDLLIVTPVDTSRAVSNWQIGVGNRPASEISPYFIGKKGSTAKQSASEAYAIGRAKIATKSVGEILYISNLTDYIVKLNRGTSAQAPAGFVERAIIVGKQAAKDNVRINKL